MEHCPDDFAVPIERVLLRPVVETRRSRAWRVATNLHTLLTVEPETLERAKKILLEDMQGLASNAFREDTVSTASFLTLQTAEAQIKLKAKEMDDLVKRAREVAGR